MGQKLSTKSVSGDAVIEKQPFAADFTFVKSEKSAKGTITLKGYASTWVKDRDQERVDPHAFDESLESYLSKNPILLWQHSHDRPFGTITKAYVDENGLYVEAEVPKPGKDAEAWMHSAYSMVAAGIVKTFSIGGMFERSLRQSLDNPGMDDIVIEKVELFEISVVSVPANPDSIFEAAVKAFSTDSAADAPPQSGKAIEQIEQLLGLKEVSDPELAVMDDDAKGARYAELMEARPEDSRIDYEEYREAVKLVEASEPVEALAKVSAIMDRLYLPAAMADSVKAGRVLSKSNESKLRQAYDTIGEVLTQVDKQPPVEITHQPAEPIDIEAELDRLAASGDDFDAMLAAAENEAAVNG